MGSFNHLDSASTGLRTTLFAVQAGVMVVGILVDQSVTNNRLPAHLTFLHKVLGLAPVAHWTVWEEVQGWF